MYYLNQEAKDILNNYKMTKVAEAVGINYRNLGKMIKQNKPCFKLTAYALTKFLDNEAEISDYFIRKEK